MLLMERVEKTLDKVQDRVEKKLSNGHPYITVSVKRIREDLDLKRRTGIDFLIRKLREDYRVGKDGSWLVIEERGRGS